jgi:uncharacterized protein (DUF305 family)
VSGFGTTLAGLATAGALILAATGCSLGSDDPAQAERSTTSTASTSTEEGPTIVQPGAPGEDSEILTPEELEAIEIPGATPADIAFMQDMVHHHAQAIRMARAVPERTERNALRLLARRLRISQEDETTMMARWLEAQDEEAFVHGDDELMPGMLAEAELDRLEAAGGDEFDRLFLEGMIRHHEGALTMVAQLYAAGGGLEPQIDAFARHVEADQQIELDRMRTLLQELEGT